MRKDSLIGGDPKGCHVPGCGLRARLATVPNHWQVRFRIPVLERAKGVRPIPSRILARFALPRDKWLLQIG